MVAKENIPNQALVKQEPVAVVNQTVVVVLIGHLKAMQVAQGWQVARRDSFEFTASAVSSQGNLPELGLEHFNQKFLQQCWFDQRNFVVRRDFARRFPIQLAVFLHQKSS